MSNVKIDAVILAAGVGLRINNISKDKPKGFIEINGKSLIQRSIKLLKKSGINNIYIVTGYKKEFFESLAYNFTNVFTINNPDYLNTGSFGSFLSLKNHIKNSFLLLESDLLYDRKILMELINDSRNNIIATSNFTNAGDEVYVEGIDSHLKNMSKDKSLFDKDSSEFIGISKISIRLFNFLIKNYSDKKLNEYEEILVKASETQKIFIKKLFDVSWCEIDTLDHLERAKQKIYPLLKK
jgi:2-aminoethylphosphonate-pyruvate transaminase